MIVWPAKDPAEVLDFTWQPALDDGDTIASYTASVSDGTVEIDSGSKTDSAVSLWLSGGADGETATLNLTATTTAGRTYREVAVLPVFDRASELLALFRLRYPAFADVTDGVIGYWLADTARAVDDTWPDATRDSAKFAHAAHMMVETGVLSGGGVVPAGVTSFKSGTFSASVSEKFASATGLSATSYGRQFIAMRAAAFGGPRLAWEPPARVC